MLRLLQGLHRVATPRGDGLRSEFLRMAGKGTPGRTIAIRTELAALAGHYHTPVAPRDAPSGGEIAACEPGLTWRSNSYDRLRTSFDPRNRGPACGSYAGMGDAECVSPKLQGERRP